MGDFFAAILGMALILFLGLCVAVVPQLLVYSYLMKRDCEVVNQVECSWQMLPKLSAELKGEK